MNVKIKLLHPNAKIPKQATEFAGGWDVTATEIIEKEPGLVICKLGFAIEIPNGHKAMFAPRSSITNTNWVIQNSPCLGDSDFRGEYQLRFRCIPSVTEFKKAFLMPFPYKEGERVGQMWLTTVMPIEFENVEALSETIRNEGGYGSTGK